MLAPAIRERVVDDLDALDDIVGFVDSHTEAGRRYEFGRILEEFVFSRLAAAGGIVLIGTILFRDT